MDATTLTTAYEIIRQPLGEILPRLSAVLAPLIPHRAAAELSTHCAHSPFKAVDESGLLTAAELTPLLASGTPGSPWQGRATVGGAEREVVAVTSDATARRSVLVFVREDAAGPVPDETLAVAQALWDLVTSHFDRFAVEALPGALARSRAAADTRARVIAELTTAHAAALSGILGVLRSRALDDGAARVTATDLAVTALIEMRSESTRDRSIAAEPAHEAFDRLADGLKTMLRHSPVRLELGPPDSPRSLAADVAHGARAVVQALLLVVLEQDSVSRVHVGWQLTEHELRATLRDDGAGALDGCPWARAASPTGWRCSAAGWRWTPSPAGAPRSRRPSPWPPPTRRSRPWTRSPTSAAANWRSSPTSRSATATGRSPRSSTSASRR